MAKRAHINSPVRPPILNTIPKLHMKLNCRCDKGVSYSLVVSERVLLVVVRGATTNHL